MIAPFDPLIEEDMKLHRQLQRKLGRWPTQEDMSNYYDEQSRLADEALRIAQEAEKIRELARRKAEEENLRRELERRAQLEERRRRHAVPSENFAIARSVDDLRKKSQSNEAFCEQTRIEGNDQAAIEIELDLKAFNLGRSVFRHVIIQSSANLEGASFAGATFEHVVFKAGSNIKEADFSHATFSSVKFEPECILDGASFQFAKFLKAIAVEFDRNNLSGSVFFTPRSDKWNALARSYSTISQIVNTILSFSYFGILILKLYIFKTMSLAEAFILYKIPDPVNAKITYSEISVFNFMFGSQPSSLVIAVILIVYQALRLFVTMRIGPLIEAERQSGYTPPRDSFMTYYSLQTLVNLLGIAAVAIFCYEIWGLATQEPLKVPI
ncbi:pentapeptide repeat-containing protein [Ensifer sp. YR511]|uniref:pentapeptide repeat-containing protein n=1 Tax=Ensifer sp. YR511 TaxID=1855294 RepID=UPI000881AE71|nr:pentapeptide repeat-containing protein [Ensifer sp. YR511]SDO20241.1 Uncharacterized protein YjbI, contains pentapeptide repeats [Ensifer sp. YR511]